MDFTRNDGPGPPPHSTLWFAIPACTVVLTVAIGMLLSHDDTKASTATGTSYDASNIGFRALYNILDELGYSIERSRYVASGTIRWALAPMKPIATDAEHVAEWVRHGGRLLLADAKGDLAAAVGIEVKLSDEAQANLISTTIDDVKELAPGKTIVTPLTDEGQMWEAAGGEPLVTIHKVGDGEVWLLHRPLALTNEQMRHGDNPIFAARLAEAMSEGKPGKIAVDEYCHGLRSRPGIIELLFQPPIRTPAIQGMLFVGILLWAAAVRFGPIRALPPPRRRSKEEFLSALGDLLHRQGDTAAAFRTIQGEVVHQLAERVGLPANTHPETIVATASRRRPMTPEVIHLLTCAAPRPGRSSFVAAVHSLDQANHELTRR
jgi:hypothetical protein